jgi:hypothetical protein
MIKAQILIELQDSLITRIWAKADGQEFTRVHLTPKDGEELIKSIGKIVQKSKDILSPRRARIGKVNDVDHDNGHAIG